MSNIPTFTTEELHDSWRESPNQWGHSRHNLSPFVGSFPPELAHYFLNWFEFGTEYEAKTVLDPFCGGGTTLLESVLLDNNVIGNDALDYATVVSQAKCELVSDEDFYDRISSIRQEAKHVENDNMELLDNDDVSVFFSDYTLDQLLRVREIISESTDPVDVYIKALVCGIIHGPTKLYLSVPTKDSYATSTNAMRRSIKEKGLSVPERDVFEKVIEKHNIVTNNSFSHSNRVDIRNQDARDLSIQSVTVDMILTSPPYMQVLDYTWNNWIRLWWLGNSRRNERDDLVLTSSEEKYRSFVQSVLEEMNRVLTDDGIAVVVVGDVKKELANTTRLINTANLFIEEASDIGLHAQLIVNDDYGMDGRTFTMFNQTKYDYDENDDKSITPIDRCVVLSPQKNRTIPHQPSINWELKEYTGQKSLSQWS